MFKNFRTVPEYLKLVKTSSKKHLELVRQICEKRKEVERNIRNCELHEQNCPTNYTEIMNKVYERKERNI